MTSNPIRTLAEETAREALDAFAQTKAQRHAAVVNLIESALREATEPLLSALQPFATRSREINAMPLDLDDNDKFGVRLGDLNEARRVYDRSKQ